MRNAVLSVGTIFLLLATCLSPRAQTAPSETAEPDIRRDATVAAVELVMPSVVNIATKIVVPVRDPYRNITGDPASAAV